MGDSRQVLLSTAIILTLPEDEAAAGVLMDRISRALQMAVEGMATVTGVCHKSGSVSVHYLGQESENAARCSRCGRWTSDVSSPTPVIDAIPEGDIQDGRLMCFPCQYLKSGREKRSLPQ